MKSWILKKLILPVADKTMGTSISAKLKQIRIMREWSKDEIESWQNQKLRDLIHHAYNHTKYYKRIFDGHSVKPTDIQIKADLTKLPVLTKRDIRENFEDLISDNVELFPYKKASTGGSTGEPLVYYSDLDSWSYTNANTIFNWERTGYQYGDKHIALGSTSLFVDKKKSFKHLIYYKLKNKIGLNGINMSNDVCRRYIEYIDNNNIKYIYGYASSIYILANYVRKKNLDVNINACFPTSEVLTDHFRNVISEAFDCKIVDFYGVNDGGITAFSHAEGFFEVGYDTVFNVEKKDQGTDNRGPILMTNLFNYSIPFINYKPEDEIHIDEVKNEGYQFNGHLINQVIGRSSDIIQLDNGALLTGPGFTILFKDLPVEYYCIEKVDGKSIVCHIKKLDDFNLSHEELIRNTFEKQMGSGVNFSINFTDEVFLTGSGKRKYVITN